MQDIVIINAPRLPDCATSCVKPLSTSIKETGPVEDFAGLLTIAPAGLSEEISTPTPDEFGIFKIIEIATQPVPVPKSSNRNDGVPR